jgi:hypothetical protein
MALGEAQKMVDRLVSAQEYRSEIVGSADKHGLSISDEYRIKVYESARNNLFSNIKSSQKNIDKNQKAIDDINNKIESLINPLKEESNEQ